MIHEVVREEKTYSQTMAVTFQWLKRVCNHPVPGNKDALGSVVQDTLWRGAISLGLAKLKGWADCWP